MTRDDRAGLAAAHMAEAIHQLRSLVGELSFDEFAADKVCRLAAERCVEIISEASRRLPQEWKEQHPAIPWADIAGIGNIIRHNYDQVDARTVWLVATRDIEPLEAALNAMVNTRERADTDRCKK